MFVIAILDDGSERNLLVSSLSLDGDKLTAVAGGAVHRFSLCDVIDVVPVDQASGTSAQVRQVRPIHRLH